MSIDIVGVDGDDTLWHSEGHFHVTQQRFAEMLEPWVDARVGRGGPARGRARNLALFGYGVKGFTLSMIETALTLTEHRIDATRIGDILAMGKELLAHPVELLDGVAETLDELARAAPAGADHQGRPLPPGVQGGRLRGRGAVRERRDRGREGRRRPTRA